MKLSLMSADKIKEWLREFEFNCKDIGLKHIWIEHKELDISTYAKKEVIPQQRICANCNQIQQREWNTI